MANRPHGDRPPQEHDEAAFVQRAGGPFERGARAARRGVEDWACPFFSGPDADAWRRGYKHGLETPDGLKDPLPAMGTRRGGGARNAAQNGALTVNADGPRRRCRWTAPRAKLTPEQVEEVRAARGRGEQLRPISARYGVTPQAISQCCKGITWQTVAQSRHENRTADGEGRGAADADLVVPGL